MAMHLSRARSNTIVSSPVISPVLQSRRSTDDQAFPSLSLQEQRDLDVAKIGGHGNGGLELSPVFHAGPAPDAHLNHLSVGQDPALLVSLDAIEPDDHAMGGLPMYQAQVSEDRPTYDFSTMEEFAKEEKGRLGIHSPTSPTSGFDFRNLGRPSTTTQTQLDENANPSGSNPPPVSNSDFSIPFNMPRARQRKISQSQPGPRRGKMALFEQQGAPPPSLTFRAPPHLVGTGTTLSAVPSYSDLPGTNNGVNGGAQGAGGAGVGGLSVGSGHDKPYRFSFYSNALSATIHAKSLSELPAEGQSFEDLFLGTTPKHHPPQHTHSHGPGINLHLPPRPQDGSRPTVKTGPGAPKSGAAPPIPPTVHSGISKMSAGNHGANVNGLGGRGGVGNGNGNRASTMGTTSADLNTWWLDIQSPTEDEMKLLGKVLYTSLILLSLPPRFCLGS